MKHFTKQNSSLCSLHGKIGIQMNNTVYTSKEKNYQFSSKKPSATKHCPPSNVYTMEFYCNFLLEYSLMGIVKPKFTRRNEIWCRILKIEALSKNVRKTQDRTSLKMVFWIAVQLQRVSNIQIGTTVVLNLELLKA